MKDKYSKENNTKRINRTTNYYKSTHSILVQRRLLTILALLIVSTLIILGSSIRAFASANSTEETVYKYYTSIQIQPGETVWSIADKYIEGFDINKADYIDEVCSMNHLKEGQIHSNSYIIVPCYSTVLK